MRGHLFLMAACSALLTSAAHAQPDSLWSRTFGGEGIDACFSIIPTTAGGIAMAGYSSSFGAGLDDFWLVCTDEEGDSLWSKTFGGRGAEWCRSLIQTANGYFVMAGESESFGADNYNIWLVCTNDEGDSIWSKTYGGPNYDRSLCHIQTTDGGFAMAGDTWSFGAGGSDFFLVKTNNEGDSLWSRTYGGERSEICFSIIQTADGGFALAGWSESFGAGETDAWLIRTNTEGDSLWSRTFGGEGSYVCSSSIIQTRDGSFVATGWTWSSYTRDYDIWLARINADGDLLWFKTFGGRGNDLCNSVMQTSDGGFALAGHTSSFGAGNSDFWLLRTDEKGDSLWSRTFGGENDDWCFSAAQTSDSGFALAGWTWSFGAGGIDFWLVKTGPDPVSVPNSDFILHPSSFILFPPFPNPFNSVAVAGYELRVAGRVNLSLYDVSGRLVRTLADGWQKAGEHRVLVNAPNLTAGEYIIVLTDCSGSAAARKVVLMK